MKVITLGGGFIADHLPYEKITDRFLPNREVIHCILSRLVEPEDVVINCIGKTGRPNVDWCESYKSDTYEANVVLPLMIAEWCENRNVHMIHIGSGCIYFGESPHFTALMVEGATKKDTGWQETDFANPQSYYSKTKYACDLVLGQMFHVTTLRIRMPVSGKNHPRNLINKLRGYKQVINIPNSMTFMPDLVRCIDWVAREHKTGIYHVVNPKPLTAVQIMEEYQRYHPEHTFDILYTEEQLDALTVAKRSNCILDTRKLQQDGFHMTPSEEALEDCIADYVNSRPDYVKETECRIRI